MRKAKADGFWGKEKRTTKTNPLLGKTFIWRSRSLQWARFRSMDARLRDFFCETPPLSAALQFVELRSAGMPYCSSSSFESTCLMWNASFFFTFFYKKWSIPGVFSAQPPTEWTMGAGDNLWCSHPCTWPVIIHTTCTQRHYMQFSRTHSFIKVCTKVTDNETNFGKALRYRICARWDCRNLNEILTNMLVFEGYLDNPKSAKTST